MAGAIALAVGCVAAGTPAILLASKGVTSNTATELWMRETGLLLMCTGFVVMATRSHPPSPTLRAILFSNVLIQIALLVVEVAAYANGTITKLSGIVPNCILHIVLALGFFRFWWKYRATP